MSKEKYGAKECIEVIKANGVYNPNIQKYFDELEELLTEYEAIKNSKPSEAVEKLEEIINYYNEPQYDVCECSYPNEFRDMWEKELITIKQALLKAEQDKKKLNEIEKLTHLLYSERRKIGQEYVKWCKENNTVFNNETNMITWVLAIKLKEWLKDE